MDNNWEIVERLRRHYDENVLGPEPRRSGCDRLMESGGKRLLAEGLSKYRTCRREIEESDLEGADAGWIDENSSILGLKPPPIFVIRLLDRDKSSIVMNKLGGGGKIGWALDKNGFERDSQLYGTNVILVPYQEHPDNALGHELLHVIYDEKSKSRSGIRDMYDAIDYDDGRLCEISSLYVETSLFGETLAHAGHWHHDEKNAKRDDADREIIREYLKARLKAGYVPNYAEFFADNADEAGILLDCGIVSKHKAKDTVKKCMAGYLGEKLDEAVDAFRTLSDSLPSSQVLKTALSCGPTREEIESGEYMRPIDELVLWSKHYKEALPSR